MDTDKDPDRAHEPVSDELYTLLRNPHTGNRLLQQDDALVDADTGERFPIRDGIPVVLRETDVDTPSRRMRRLFDVQWVVYDVTRALTPGLNAARVSFAELLGVERGERVLESCVGTGQQLRRLDELEDDARYVGLDISTGMLGKCRKNAGKWSMTVGLVQSDAMGLPFADDTFDRAYEFGGISMVPRQREGAIEELVRVVAPGGHVGFVQATEKLASARWLRPYAPLLRWIGIPSGQWAPRSLPEAIPREGGEVRREPIWGGYLSAIVCRLPE